MNIGAIYYKASGKTFKNQEDSCKRHTTTAIFHRSLRKKQ